MIHSRSEAVADFGTILTIALLVGVLGGTGLLTMRGVTLTLMVLYSVRANSITNALPKKCS